MTPGDGFQIVLCVLVGNFLTLLIIAMSWPKKKEEDKNDTEIKG